MLTWVASVAIPLTAAQPPAPAPAPPLVTRWAAALTPATARPEYPRPQLVRRGWMNLNGAWDFAITPRGADRPRDWDGRVVVPFCVESMLSGVAREVGPERELWYRRSFAAPEIPDGGRLLLHFGAVDWRATVLVNGHALGTHEGGYDAFSFDVTDALVEGPNELVVRVWDPTDAGYQPRGKQVREPGGIWYTAVTGIWQTVWLEPVPATSIGGLRITPVFDDNTVRIEVETRGKVDGLDVVFETSIDGREDRIIRRPGETIVFQPRERIPAWSPDEPTLHEFTVTLRDRGGSDVDRVESYFGLRSIAMGKDGAGINRLLLNGKPLFQYGTLDQGWWPDGLYTAPADEALRYDLEITKKLGFNMVRKHVKIECARWYHWCDRLGLLVWQDMPSGDRYIHGDMPDIERSPESAAGFERELGAMMHGVYNHPSVVVWVPYNEGWGQWDTERIAALVESNDPTRLVNPASGWTDRGAGDIQDIHSYPGPAIPDLEAARVATLGEFGGLGLPVAGHLWQEDRNWGYRTYQTSEDLTTAYVQLLRRLHVLIGRGLSAAVYTQTTDVETEVNGLMTYDRAIVKMDVEHAAQAARRLHRPPPTIETIVARSAESGAAWRYRSEWPSEGPPDDWHAETYDDTAWKTGRGGFGTKGTPAPSVGTRWDGTDIWIRRTVELDRIPPGLELLLHHDEDAEVYLNGTLAVCLRGYVTDYVTVPIAADAIAGLRRGKNVIAIHCRQTGGGQFIDAGLVSVRWAP